ncbi:maker646 [Drosophila busckii]|uniref:Maker646 n=1 Tax=Drosophila busckii TaxID=30019 RepID=A0A0M4EHJ5_DROBS|nr:uncharacterized protein LOC108598915 [Drosophila busckii]ALC43188.1 maker646 [Drosophila busckii]
MTTGAKTCGSSIGHHQLGLAIVLLSMALLLPAHAALLPQDLRAYNGVLYEPAQLAAVRPDMGLGRFPSLNVMMIPDSGFYEGTLMDRLNRIALDDKLLNDVNKPALVKKSVQLNSPQDYMQPCLMRICNFGRKRSVGAYVPSN